MTIKRATVMLLALVIAFACMVSVAQAASSRTSPAATGGSYSPVQAPSPKKASPVYDINVVPEADMRADSIKMSITIFNNEKWAFPINVFSTQNLDFLLLDANGKTLYQWSAGKKFSAIDAVWLIPADKPYKFSFTLSGGAYNAIKDKIATFRAYVMGDAGFINRKGYEVDLRPDKQLRVTAQAEPGKDSLKMSLSIYNGSRRDVSIEFSSSQKYLFELYDAKNKRLYSNASPIVYRIPASVTIKAGKTLTFSQTISGSDYQNIRQKISYMKAYANSNASFVDQNGYKVKYDPGVYVTVTPDARLFSTYMTMSLTINNNSEQEISIKSFFGLNYNFQLLDASGKVIYNLALDKSVSKSGAVTKIGPGKSVTWTQTVSGDAYKAIKNRVVSLRAYAFDEADFLNADGYVLKLKQ